MATEKSMPMYERAILPFKDLEERVLAKMMQKTRYIKGYIDAAMPISEDEKPFSLRKYTKAKFTIEIENCDTIETKDSLFLYV